MSSRESPLKKPLSYRQYLELKQAIRFKNLTDALTIIQLAYNCRTEEALDQLRIWQQIFGSKTIQE